MTEVVFSTIHGSHLYGMANDTSDTDVFRVTTGTMPRAHHSVDRLTLVDTCTVGWDTYLKRIFEGSHQSVEALFSPFKVWHSHEELRDFIEGMRVTGPRVFEKYERTIKRFCYGDFKRRRHAVRLNLNLADLRNEGRFNPVMMPFAVQYANNLATEWEGEDLWLKLVG